MGKFAGEPPVVTGGASGTGLAMAHRLLAEGVRVVLSDIEEVLLGAATATLITSGGEVLAVAGDLRDAATADGWPTRPTSASAPSTSSVPQRRRLPVQVPR